MSPFCQLTHLYPHCPFMHNRKRWRMTVRLAVASYFVNSLSIFTLFNWLSIEPKKKDVIDSSLQMSGIWTVTDFFFFSEPTLLQIIQIIFTCAVRCVLWLASRASVSTYKQSFPCLRALSATGLPQDVCQSQTCNANSQWKLLVMP